MSDACVFIILLIIESRTMLRSIVPFNSNQVNIKKMMFFDKYTFIYIIFWFYQSIAIRTQHYAWLELLQLMGTGIYIIWIYYLLLLVFCSYSALETTFRLLQSMSLHHGQYSVSLFNRFRKGFLYWRHYTTTLYYYLRYLGHERVIYLVHLPIL